MHALFVMHAMALGPLKEKPQPIGRPHVPVVNQFGKPAQQHTAGRRGRTQANNEVKNRARQRAVRENFKRVLVKTGDDLNPPRTVMHLVKPPPKEITLVPPAVPPVKEKRNRQIAGSRAARHAPSVRMPWPV